MDDLPRCLRARPELVRGTEPVALLAGEVGVLLLHGFTGSPWELAPLANRLVAAGYSVAMPVLAGHATRVRDLERVAWNDWLATAADALHWLQARAAQVHMVGLSMGALLAMMLARGGPRGFPRSLALLAPALTLRPVAALGISVAETLGWPPRVGKADPRLPSGERAPAYSQIPIGPTASLVELMRLVRAGFAAPSCPTLVLHGSRDRTIPMVATRRIVRRLMPAAEHVVVRGGGHLLARSRGCGEVLERVQTFIRTASPRAAAPTTRAR